MNRFPHSLFFLLLILISSLLTGCSSSTPIPWTPVPSQDPATIVAAAVSTVSSQMTEEAIRNPSPTPQPTSTPEPTATPVPPTPTAEPTLEVTVSAATATAEPASAQSGSYGPLSAEMLYVTTYPENKREYLPNETFSVAIGMRNNGTITWDEEYTIKLTRADGEITAAPDAKLGRTVAPGEKAEFNLWAFGSETLGKHTWYFQVYNSQGVAVPGGATSFTYTSY